ncbi:MAG: response regulator [Chitinispirillales bacterium]|jgi:signal transduction histidine kinase/DNA-binding response OmpR family regulator|nr:response regulator [Chitinispirillales bacterium]
MSEVKKNSVLIVDDDKGNIMALTDILISEYIVYAERKGLDAVAAAEKYLPDVILLDIIMPEMDGYAVISALKNSEKTKNIPVIFITGLGGFGAEEKGLAFGAADYISKPFSRAIVKLRIRNQIKIHNKLSVVNETLDIMGSILNKTDAMIYVTDPDTDRVLFVNDFMKRHFGIEGDVVGRLCYEVFQKGFDQRCYFCPCRQLDKDPNSVVIWEEHNTLTNCYYRNYDRYIDWPSGKKVHIQHCVDLTDIRKLDDLLYAVNNAAALLLNCDTESFENNLYQSMSLMSKAVNVDRMYIWKNFTVEGRLHCAQLYEWSEGAEPQQGKEFTRGIPYSENIPRWERELSEDECINGILCDMPPEEQELLAPQGILSILAVPIFIKESFWGFVGFDDCHCERQFTEKEESILRSGSILVASALLRNQMVQSIRDTSAQLETALEQATVASKAKGDFLSTMSHEMRTPMNAIIGMTAIGKKARDIEQKDRALNKIEDASTHLLGVINDVLDMAKIEADKLELSPTEFNFERMLQKTMTVANFRVDEKRQVMTVSIDNKIPGFIIGDDQRLTQVITNLLSNAVKFTPEGGKIHIEATLAGETAEDCELRIEVSDSGIGISPEQRDRLFLPFEQAESGTSRKFGGTGLGLVISKRIVELMGGRIWVESELGTGARFIFTVKVQRGRKEDDNASECSEIDSAAAYTGAFEGKRMLLAEDIEINREIVMAFLENTGIIIDCAEDGKKALDMIEATPGRYDVVLMDVQMPRMDGLEATRRIRALPAALPIIAMTANVFKADIEECLAAGMDDHVGKPLDIEKVLEKLRKYLKT